MKYKLCNIHICLFQFLMLAVLSFSSITTHAANRYWVGSAGGNWSSTANWSTSSGGAGGASVPGAADIAIFDGTDDDNATVDAGYAGTVDGVLISAGYTGTISQSRNLVVEVSNFIQSDGTWSGSTYTMTINGGGTFSQSGGTHNAAATLDINDGSFVLNGGTFNHPATVLNVERNFTYSGGTYNGNIGTRTIVFDDSNISDVSTIRCSGNLLSITGLGTVSNIKDSTGGIVVDSGCEVNAAVSSTNGSVTINSGGTLLNIGNWASATLVNSGALIADAGTFTVTGETSFGGNMNNLTAVISFDINDGGVYVASGKTLTVGAPNLFIEKNLTVYGTFNISGKNITFDGANAGDDTTLNCIGDFNTTTGVATVKTNKSGSPTFTLANGCEVDITVASGNVAINSGGTLNSVGNWNSGALTNSGALNAAVGTFTVTGEASFGGTISNLSNTTSFDINDGGVYISSGKTLTVGSSQLNIEKNLTMNGSFNISGKNLTFDGGNAGDDTIMSCISDFNNNTGVGSVSINKTGAATFTLSGGCEADITVTNGIITINSGATFNSVGNWNSSTLTNIGALNADSGTFVVGAEASFGGTINNLSSVTSFDVNDGGVYIASGKTLNVGVSTLYIEKNFTNNGTLNALNTKTLVFDGGNIPDVTTYNNTAPVGAITINKTLTNYFMLGSNTTVLGNFVRTSGVGSINVHGSTYTLYVGGDLTIDGGDSFGGAKMTLEINGTGSQTISIDANPFNPVFKINKPSGEATIANPFIHTTQACELASGTLNIGNNSFSCGGAFTVQSGTTLKMAGDNSVTQPTLQSGSNVIFIGDGDGTADSMISQNWIFKNLSINMTDSSDSIGTSNSNTLATNLFANWKLNDGVGVSAGDSSGNGKTLTLTGTWDNTILAPLAVTNTYSLSLNGTSNYAYTADSPGLPTTDFTYSFWVYPSNFSGDKTVLMVGNGGNGAGGNEILVTLDNASGIVTLFLDGATSISGSTGLTAGRWQHVAFSRQGSAVKIYINGALDGTGTEGDAFNFSTCRLHIGVDMDTGCNASPGEYYSGRIDEVHVYSRALNEAEIKHLARGYDTTLFQNNIDVNGNFTLQSGTYLAPPETTVAGNWTKTGGQLSGSDTTVTLDTAATATISGDTTFIGLKSATNNKTIKFAAGSTTTITGDFTLDGSVGNEIILRSDTTGSFWKLNSLGSHYVDAVNVRDSDARGGNEIFPTSSIGIGWNPNWNFGVSPPFSPSNLGSTNYVTSIEVTDNTPTLTFDIDDSDNELVGFRIQIDDTNNFSSVVLDYTSALGTEGSKSFTVGQTAGTGTYLTGGAGQHLPKGDYYWRVTAYDASLNISGATTANSGNVAFYLRTFTVSKTEDTNDGTCDTDCSLREAITAVNADGSSPRYIYFNIPGGTDGSCTGDGGVCTISPTSALPSLTAANINIDGYTQKGALANTAHFPLAMNAIVKIGIAGTYLGGGTAGLTIDNSNTTIKGLSIYSFPGIGINVPNSATNTGIKIQGNFIGLRPDGTTNSGNGGSGVESQGTNVDNFIIGIDGDGTNDEQERNIIASNTNSQIGTRGDSTIMGNFIGTDRYGLVDLGTANYENVWCGSGTVTIGTNGDGINDSYEGNIIVGAATDGIELLGGCTNSTIAGNYVGVGRNGTTNVGNSAAGIVVGANNVTIGTDGDGISDSIEGNIVSGNVGKGLSITSSSVVIAGNKVGLGLDSSTLVQNDNVGIAINSDTRIGTNGDGISDTYERNYIGKNLFSGIDVIGASNTIAGNFIGVNLAGYNAGNGDYGINLIGNATDNIVIGGDSTSESNIIGYNGYRTTYDHGINIGDGAVNAMNNQILRNSFFSNDGKGIHIVTGGTNNNNQPAPVILTVSPGVTTISVSGTSSANATVQLFDASSDDEGENYMGGSTADGSGNWSIILSQSIYTANNNEIVATATDAANGTSEFSTAYTLTNTAPDAPASLGPVAYTTGINTTDTSPTITFTQNDPDNDSVRFRIQMDDNSDFSSPFLDYLSPLSADGTASYTPGDTGGTYNTGTQYTKVPYGNVYWRVQTIDFLGSESSYTTANGGGIGFVERIYTVTKTAVTADGTCDLDCSLSEALTAANANATYYTVEFGIPATDSNCDVSTVCTISPTSALPTITRAGLTINGYSQFGASLGTNPWPQSINATIKIGINGNSAPNGTDGIIISANDVVIKGLSIYGFNDAAATYTAHAISAPTNNTADRIKIQGCFIGVLPDGETSDGNQGRGISLLGAGNDNHIIGTDSDSISDHSERNLISANQLEGIFIEGDAAVAGNFIGTDKDGTVDLGNLQEGITGTNRVGTDGNGINDQAEGNLISGNNGTGIYNVFANGVIAGNYVGVDATGNADLGNSGDGIACWGPANLRVGTNGDGSSDVYERNIISGNNGSGIGMFQCETWTIAGNYFGLGANGTSIVGNTGTGMTFNYASNWRVGTNGDGVNDSLEGNYFSGNGSDGIRGNGLTTAGHIIAGNRIGITITGSDAGNSNHGLNIGGDSYTIGGDSTVEANIIAYNGNAANEHGLTISGVYNQILGNSIYNNQNLGIDLASGGNNDISNPTVTTLTADGTYKQISGSHYPLSVIQIFATDSNNDEGQTFLGTTTANALGYWSYDLSSPYYAKGNVISLTATSGPYGTSEFGFYTITSVPPYEPKNLGTTDVVNGGSITTINPVFVFTLSDLDSSDTVRYQIQVDDDADFSSPSVDYISALHVQGTSTFTLGQSADGGTYLQGSVSQTLAEDSYYWRVKTIDQFNEQSSYAEANNGNVAFIQSKEIGTPSAISTADHTWPFDIAGEYTYSSSDATVYNGYVSLDGTNDSDYPTHEYKRSIVVSNAEATSVTDLPVRIQLDGTNFSGSFDSINSDCSDLRFRISSGTPLSHYTETCNPGSSKIVVWVEMNSLSASSSATVEMFYGHEGATNLSSANDVFIFYDGFDGTTIDMSKWTIDDGTGFSVANGYLTGTNTTGRVRSISTYSSGIVLETKTINTAIATNGQTICGFWSATNNAMGVLIFPGNTYTRTDSTWTAEGGGTIPQTNYILCKLEVTSSTNVNASLYNVDLDAMDLDMGASTNTVSNEPITLGKRYDNGNTGQSYNTLWDWVRIRKYFPTPAVNVGSEKNANLYPSAVPVTTNIGYGFESLSAFEVEYGPDNVNDAEFQVSNDNGGTWKYWNGATWATVLGDQNRNSAFDVNLYISMLPEGTLKVKTFLLGNRFQSQVDGINITTGDHTWPFTIADEYTYSTSDATVYGGYVSLDGTSDVDYGNFQFKREIEITSANFSTVTDYSMLITLNNTNFSGSFDDINDDCSDLRFKRGDGNPLDHYVETCNPDGSNIEVWVNIDSLSGLSTTTTTIEIFYGAASVQNLSTGDTFLFYDGFDGTSINTGKWTIDDSTGFSVSGGYLRGTNTSGRLRSTSSFSSGVIQETMTQTSSVATNGQHLCGFWTSTSLGLGFLAHPGTIYTWDDAVWTNLSTGSTIASNKMLCVLDVINSTTVDMYLYDKNLDTLAADAGLVTNSVSNRPVTIGKRYDNGNTGQTYSTNWDWIRVRKRINSIPTYTIGSALPVNNYPISIPIVTDIGYPFLEIASFDVDYGPDNIRGAEFQISNDNGSSWKYWSGTSWTTVAGDGSRNTLDEVHTNIGSLPAGTLKVKSFLLGGGNQSQIDGISIKWANDPPNSPYNLGPTQHVNGSWISTARPTVTFTMDDTDDGDQLKYRIQFDNNADFSSPVVDFTSGGTVEGNFSFTVGQVTGDGTYSVGNPGQHLFLGDYFWRVKAIDMASAESSYTTARGGGTAFHVDVLTITVTGDGSDGACDAECSLRDAINVSNSSNVDNIEFNIPTTDPGNVGGICTITPSSTLPFITNAGLTINGYSQSGASPGTNNFPSPINASLKVVIDGTSAGAAVDGLTVNNVGNVTIKGLVINQFKDEGILVTGASATGVRIQGCFIGTDVTGELDRGNFGHGIETASNAVVTVGSDTNGVNNAAERNLVSGNNTYGVFLGGYNNYAMGNFVGTDKDGDTDLGNSSNGIGASAWYTVVGTNGDGTADSVEGNLLSGNDGAGLQIIGNLYSVFAGNLIGTKANGTQALGNSSAGVDAGGAQNRIGTNADGISDVYERNIISGNASLGGIYNNNTNSNIIAGNYIGLGIDGSTAVSNTYGIYYNAAFFNTYNMRIGTNGDGIRDDVERNVISGNSSHGILLNGNTLYNNIVAGNYIGLSATGSFDKGNGGHGIAMTAGTYNNIIGGDVASEANVIAYNGDGAGEYGIYVAGAGSDGNRILRNSIWSNQNQGIELDGAGANNDNATPVITSHSCSGSNINIIGTSAGGSETIQVFDADTSDQEGEIYLSEGYSDTAGNWRVKIPNGTGTVVATATNSTDGTSEFSASFAPSLVCNGKRRIIIIQKQN